MGVTDFLTPDSDNVAGEQRKFTPPGLTAQPQRNLLHLKMTVTEQLPHSALKVGTQTQVCVFVPPPPASLDPQQASPLQSRAEGAEAGAATCRTVGTAELEVTGN